MNIGHTIKKKSQKPIFIFLFNIKPLPVSPPPYPLFYLSSTLIVQFPDY